MVVVSPDNALMAWQPYQQLTANIWAVVLPKEPSAADVERLQIVYLWARNTVTAATAKRADDIDTAALVGGFEHILQKLTDCDQVRGQISAASRCHEEATMLITRLEREVRETINALLAGVNGEEAA